MPKGRGMVKWTPFAAMTEQFDGIREIIKEKNKVARPILTSEKKNLSRTCYYAHYYLKKRC